LKQLYIISQTTKIKLSSLKHRPQTQGFAGEPKYCLQDCQGLLSLSQVLSPKLHEDLPPLPVISFSRLTFPQRCGPGIAHAVSTCKPENELSIFDGRATAAVKYGIYCGEMLPLFPARPPFATSAGGMDRTDYTGFRNRNGGKLS
jgi:hypothetical protein